MNDNGIGAELVMIKEGISQQGTDKNHIHGHIHDHSVQVFFTLSDLKLGKVIPIYFRAYDPSTSPHFLPREESELLPFSLSKLSLLLNHFGFHGGSSQAKAMEDTLRECEMEPIEGETKLCATSLESMLDFVSQIMDSKTEFQGLSTKQLMIISSDHDHHHDLKNYTVLDEPREVKATKMVACHTMPYPYAVFYCHYQKSESKVFKVSLGCDDGSKVEAIAVCHMDTSSWSPNHISFHVLGIQPGSSPVCHFFPADHLVWVPLIFDHAQVQVM